MGFIADEVERITRIAEINGAPGKEKPQTKTGSPSPRQAITQLAGKHYRPLTQDTAYEAVLAHYTLPFPLYKFQVEAVDHLSGENRSGLFFEPGTGKTVTATAMTLYKFLTGVCNQAIVIMPPILLDQWAHFLTDIPGVSVQVYRGTPAKRRDIVLGEADFTLVGSTIFKKDIGRFESAFGPDTAVIRDEAHDIKNVSTANYRTFTRFVADKSAILLTGTPVSSPEDAYAYIKIVVPSLYRTKAHFMNLHAGQRDFFNNVISWKNLDVLADNMTINTRRVLKEDVLAELPPVTYTPLFYELDAGHYTLYKKLAEEQLIELGEGKIDATSTQKLFHALGQLVCNYSHFAADESKRSACYDVLDQVLDEIGPRSKLVVFAKYRMTNRNLLRYLQKYNAVAAYGDQTIKQNLAAVEMFIGDPDCRVFVAQPTSAGTGLDGLHHVCRDAIFLELPALRDFQQASARLHRAGQKNGVHIRLATAQRTLQVRQQAQLLANDELVNTVIRNVQDLRQALYGA